MARSINTQKYLDQLRQVGTRFMRYRIVVFIALVVITYGFVLYKINDYNSLQPSPSAIASQSQAVASAHIDKNAASQLEKLQNNSVSVQALFEQARTNPFQD